jgi:hypothetical protein
MADPYHVHGKPLFERRDGETGEAISRRSSASKRVEVEGMEILRRYDLPI